MATEVWRDLGESMRRLRKAAGQSVRDVEQNSRWTRGTLSQAENAKARPSRQLVDWYDEQFQGHGLLLALYVEARSMQSNQVAPARNDAPNESVGAAEYCVLSCNTPAGLRVAVDEKLQITWRLANTGGVPWHGLSLQRVSAYAGARLISSPRSIEVPDIPRHETVDLGCLVQAPAVPGAAVAYWRLVDADGRHCLASNGSAVIVLVVESANRVSDVTTSDESAVWSSANRDACH